MPLVVADRLSKRYGARVAVQDVSFSVMPGQVLGLLGPNGSGKSSILRMLTGYLRASGGAARVAGFDLATQSLQARRCIGYVPEDIPLYPQMRVDEFLAFIARIKGLPAQDERGAIDAACARLDLAAVRRLPIGKLSRGFRQRVAIAQALLGAPPLLVFDEPTNGLDPRQIIDMRHLIRELSRTHTLIVTSHVLTEIEQVASHVAIMLNGRLLTTQPLVPAGAGRRVQFQLAGADTAAVRTCVATVPGVQVLDLVATAGGLVLGVALDDETVASHLAAALVRQGIALRRMAEPPSDLEALFLRVTAGGQDARLAA